MEATNILFFTCFNTRSIQLESSIRYFQRKGYHVTLLTTCEKGPLHAALEKNGIRAEAIRIAPSPRLLYYPGLLRFLISYSKKNRIHFIHSHLQVPNLVSSFARFFIRAEVFTVRHNSDVVMLSGSRKEQLIDRIVNRLSSTIIAISDKVKTQLILQEQVNPAKIYRINNGYDFAEYDKLSAGSDAFLQIRRQYGNEFLVVSPGRLIPTKRHDLAVKGLKLLRSKGYAVKLLILGDGPDAHKLQELIAAEQLQEHAILCGYRENISDYLKAADAVALLSESEASNNTVKEAAYFEKPVIVCEDVGDFSDYIVNEKNGFLLPKQQPLEGFVKRTEQLYNNRQEAGTLGRELKKTVISAFDIETVGQQYEALQNQKRKL